MCCLTLTQQENHFQNFTFFEVSNFVKTSLKGVNLVQQGLCNQKHG